ncbi:MAG: TonB-dependent receptor [Saprospiraceae bacterium]|nr:TonB-dependent receptor [Saprospiraceae bacterium]
MKSTCLIPIFLLVCSIACFGQSPLDHRISLIAQGLPLKEALYNLIDQDAKISFNNSIIPSNKTINLQASNERLGDALPKLLEGTDLGFEVVGSQIVIIKKPQNVNVPIKRFHTISGSLTDAATGEHVINGTLYDAKRNIGTYTNEYGHFSLTAREGPLNFIVSSLGYNNDTLSFELTSSRRIEVKLMPSVLATVIVSNFNDSSLVQTGIGQFELNLEHAKRLPSLGGETDVLRVGHTMPGIQTGGDGFGGISVRGGDVDQNLFLLDGVPIYNASHGLGIFSIYNAAAVRSAKILKSSFPAQYGGRISSIWDVQTKEGNMNEKQGELEIGLGSIQLNLEGPINKGNGSWFVSGRRSLFNLYSEQIVSYLNSDKNVKRELDYFFQDFNAKINYKISQKDRVFLSLYRGNDKFFDNKRRFFTHEFNVSSELLEEKLVRWGNQAASLRWNHLVSDKVFANITAIYSRYQYDADDLYDLILKDSVETTERSVFFQKYFSSITDLGIKTDFDYFASRNHRIRFGTSFLKHSFQPAIINFDRKTLFNEEIRDTIGTYLKSPLRSSEMDIYLQDEMKIGKSLTANIGLRASGLLVGDKTIYKLQPRLLFSLFDGEPVSYSMAVTRNAQFLHLLSPTGIGLPKDFWVSATEKAPPQTVWHFSLGTNLKPKKWLALDFEMYFNRFDNLVYFQGNTLEDVSASNWQDEIALGNGTAYGLELLAKVERGKVGGWLSYTYGRSDRLFNKEGNTVNNGKRFPIWLDRRHNANIQFLYKISQNWDFSLGFVIASGSAFTFPSLQYDIEQSPTGFPDSIIVEPFPVITDLNSFRIRFYNRLDFNITYQFYIRNVKHSLKLGAYNAYLRRNPTYYKPLRGLFANEDDIWQKAIEVRLIPFFPTLRYILEIK